MTAVQDVFQAIKDRDFNLFLERFGSDTDPNSRTGNEADDNHLLWAAATSRTPGLPSGSVARNVS